MSKIQQIGICIDGKGNNHPIFTKLLDNFPLPPCYIGTVEIRNTYKFDFVSLWEYEQHDDEWTLSDSLIDYLFVEHYRAILSLSDLGYATDILATEELDRVFKFGHYKHRLYMCYLMMDKKDHDNEACFTSKEYIRYIVNKFKTKSVAYLAVLDLLNKNPILEDNLVSLIKLSLNQIVSIKNTLDKNIHLLEGVERKCYFEIFENICLNTKSTAIKLSINNKDNFLTYWKDM